MEALLRETVDVAILDLAMPHFRRPGSAAGTSNRARGFDPADPDPDGLRIGHAAMESARRGAVDFLRKPITPTRCVPQFMGR